VTLDALKGQNRTGPTWDDFVAGKQLLMESFRTDGWVGFADQIQGGKPFGTKTGKIEVTNDWLKATNAVLNGEAAPYTPFPTYGRYFPAFPSYMPPARGFHDPLTTKYPLMMLSSHTRYRNHSAFFMNPMLRGEVYTHELWLSATDAIARGISDGDTVRVYNDLGSMIMTAYVTKRTSPGVVLSRLGGWFRPDSTNRTDWGGCYNSLAGDLVSPVLEAKGSTIVEVEKLQR